MRERQRERWRGGGWGRGERPYNQIFRQEHNIMIDSWFRSLAMGLPQELVHKHPEEMIVVGGQV